MQKRDAIRAIKERLNLVDIARRYVELKRNGPRWMAPCPFHQETKPSFSIVEETGLFYCFGCKASGDVFDFYGRINGLDFSECLEQLAEEAGIDLDTRREGGAADGGARQQQRSERQQMLRMYELAAAHYARNLAGAYGGACRAYVERRGIDRSLAERFGLGYALPGWQDLADALRRNGCSESLAMKAGLLGKSDKGRVYDRLFRGRLIFPIRNLSNQVIAFGGRIIGDEDEAKYINSADSPIYRKGDQLYALPQARRHIAVKATALLTEGYMDVLTLHQFGYEHAVGVLGTALTPEQVKRLSGFTSQVTLLFDGDAAGRKAAQRACELLLPRGLACRVVLLPQGQDIDDLLRKQGAEEFEKLLGSAPDGLRFCLDTVKRHMAPRDAVIWARDFLRNVIELPELYYHFASSLAHALNLSETELKGGVLARQKGVVVSGRGTDAAGEADPDAFERQVLRFMARYPHRCRDLQEAGADVFLQTSRARDVWKKCLAYPADEIPYHLDAWEKAFWMRCRTGEAPPLDNEEGELAPLLQKIAARHKKMASNSVAAALRSAAGTGDFASDREYIVALRETQRTDDEQS
ncbi:MAG: DNA primase [Deltaproteobacteria bacterium]|jgi:DNA primase|nr:DNA primase [Deltaproteobacteria bacterium]